MKRFLAGAALAALMAVPAQAQDADTVLATVNGADITLGHLIAMQALLPEQYQQLPDQVLFDGMLEQLVQQEVVAGAARQMVTPRMELGLENEERAFMAAAMMEMIAMAEISEEDLQTEYDRVYGSAEPAREFDASHILVETEEAAAALVEELAGGADFAELAQQHSTGPSGPNGGQLGWFTAGMMVPSFEEAVFELEVGEVSAPVETQFGWHVIILNDSRLQDAPELDDVRAELINGLRNARVETRMEELVSEAEVERPEIEIDPALIRDMGLLEN
ncbi:peptidylprolyl isomerase [Roseobacter sp. HKCCD9010]|uniref:peptidylprolyl isomerase n=1 Tax=unclassified Roseobacter TaxID=196798 RepID=UPI001492ABE0|nr:MULTISPECIES: peptidylprolyl isomerase [unclassified Roseobacter]MBF9051164.1 peptidylprolyl isomerase [Rhodobacterales bacterium HKCCD4356]NNV12933.1 peptidylprolyl isomerase [Roseobacter sp. HKCCD7357]NNV16878.1 peptidylprolyl isomerase [Roseobacter sp. HKCCD8768]NNV26490.1 peptidylprolyl isomerase [Roseobacter sp. HKCCD8192]NNV30599.1 peptidylprolyl isomerase [Roseobacter sp. HKCCD9061]